MIDFLVASNVKGNVDRLILLNDIPVDLKSTIKIIDSATGNNVQCTRSDVENTTIALSPSNYLENIDQYLLHVIERAANKSVIVALYKIEHDGFRSIRKFIASISNLKKENIPC